MLLIDIKNQAILSKSSQGFTVLEAVLASAVLAMSLAGSVRLSSASLTATQAHRNLDLASGLAQDLAECWGVQTAICTQQFSSSQWSSLSNDPTLLFTRTWQISAIPIPGAPAWSLQELRVTVRWPDGRGHPQGSELVWRHRRASTPSWAGL